MRALFHLAYHVHDLDAARAGSDPMHMPVRAVLAANTPLTLYWCP